MTTILTRFGRIKRSQANLRERFMFSALRASILPLACAIAETVEPFGGRFFG